MTVVGSYGGVRFLRLPAYGLMQGLTAEVYSRSYSRVRHPGPALWGINCVCAAVLRDLSVPSWSDP